MNKLKKDILQLIRKVVNKLGYLLIDVELKGTRNNPFIEVFVDGKKAVTTEDCSLISREIEKEIDAEGTFDFTRYRLDVSSPGINRPLKFIEQFEKHLGREFSLKFKENEKVVHLKCRFIGIEGNLLTFEKNNKLFKIKFENIIKAKVEISF